MLDYYEVTYEDIRSDPEIQDWYVRFETVNDRFLQLVSAWQTRGDTSDGQERVYDRLARTVERHVVSNGFSVVREFVGHGIGTKLHEEPQIPNYVDRKNENPKLKAGMVLAVEPMVNAGGPESKVRGYHHMHLSKLGLN